MTGYRFWDSDRIEAIPADGVLEVDNMLYDVMLSPGALALAGDGDPTLADRARRLLSGDFGIIEFLDESTVLVELLNGPETLASLQKGGSAPPLRCLIIG